MANSPQPTHSKAAGRSRRGRRGRASSDPAQATSNIGPITKGVTGGRFRPIAAADLLKLDRAIRHVLTTIGLSELPPLVIETVTPHGGRVSADGRLTFPEPLIDQFLQTCERNFTLYGQTPGHELVLSGAQVHVGTGGAAPQVVDLETGRYRPSTLRDLYDAARLTDTLDHIHFFSRSLVARDMPTDWLLDLNTAYASLIGTAKHVCTSITQPAHVAPLAELFFLLAGSREAFVERPFVSLNINHVVSPLRLHKESCEVLAEAARLGIPVHCNVFSQVGASCPVTLAGSVVQNSAEALAGMIFAWLINPKVKAIMGVRPMMTDLRTGGMSGGSGEQALVMAATAQMAHYYDLPNTCIAGATDSKLADAQSGYEKSMTVSLAAQAGSNMITQACGMHAGLMAVAFESYIIDNDMLGGILRSLAPFEVNDVTLATEMIEDVVRGEGHFLGHPETYRRMQTHFLYPMIADRRAAAEWEADGARDIRAVARQKARHLLNTYYPKHVSAEIDQQIRARFDIRLAVTRDV